MSKSNKKCTKCNGEGCWHCTGTGEEPMTQDIQERLEDFDRKFANTKDKDGLSIWLNEPTPEYLKEWITQAIALSVKAKEKEILELLDKAETEKWFDMSDTTDNWKTWKRIRNTISPRKRKHEPNHTISTQGV